MCLDTAASPQLNTFPRTLPGVSITNFVYSDLVGKPAQQSQPLGGAVLSWVAVADLDWRLAYRQNTPEKDDVKLESLTARFLSQRAFAHGPPGSRHAPEVQRLIAAERTRAKKRAEDARK